MFSISSDITKPKPPTRSLPFGTSIFCGVSCFDSVFVSTFVSVLVSVLVAVGDDVVADDDTSGFGAAIDGGASTCISAGAGGGASATGGAGATIGFIGLIGLTGLLTFVGFVTDFTQLFCISTH